MASIRADVEKTINEKYKASPEYLWKNIQALRYSDMKIIVSWILESSAIGSFVRTTNTGWAGFKAIGNEKDVDDIMKMVVPSSAEKLISEYSYAKNLLNDTK